VRCYWVTPQKQTSSVCVREVVAQSQYAMSGEPRTPKTKLYILVYLAYHTTHCFVRISFFTARQAEKLQNPRPAAK